MGVGIIYYDRLKEVQFIWNFLLTGQVKDDLLIQVADCVIEGTVLPDLTVLDFFL